MNDRMPIGLDAIRARDRDAIARIGDPESDQWLRAEMDRRYLIGALDQAREELAWQTDVAESNQAAYEHAAEERGDLLASVRRLRARVETLASEKQTVSAEELLGLLAATRETDDACRCRELLAVVAAARELADKWECWPSDPSSKTEWYHRENCPGCFAQRRAPRRHRLPGGRRRGLHSRADGRHLRAHYDGDGADAAEPIPTRPVALRRRVRHRPDLPRLRGIAGTGMGRGPFGRVGQLLPDERR